MVTVRICPACDTCVKSYHLACQQCGECFDPRSAGQKWGYCEQHRRASHRRPNSPCAGGCGKMLYGGRMSIASGEQVCRDCRREYRRAQPRKVITRICADCGDAYPNSRGGSVRCPKCRTSPRRSVLCAGSCGKMLVGGATSLPAGQRMCLSCRNQQPRCSFGECNKRATQEAIGRCSLHKLVSKHGTLVTTLCYRCKQPFTYIHRTSYRMFCDEHINRRVRDETRPSTNDRGYGAQHQRRRREMLPLAYGTECAKCHELMDESMALDADHSVPLAVVPGPRLPDRIVHARCNRAQGTSISIEARMCGRQRIVRPRPPRKIEHLPCPICGIVTDGARRTYCSKECAAKGRHSPKAKTKWPDIFAGVAPLKTCPCGSLFRGPHKHCSDVCRLEWNARLMRERYRASRGLPSTWHIPVEKKNRTGTQSLSCDVVGCSHPPDGRKRLCKYRQALDIAS
jgi:hypothetical protein